MTTKPKVSIVIDKADRPKERPVGKAMLAHLLIP